MSANMITEGIIDELRMYPRELTQREIDHMFTAFSTKYPELWQKIVDTKIPKDLIKIPVKNRFEILDIN